MAKHLQVVSVERARDTSYGRELVGLCVRIPWSSWDSYADGSGFDTGTVVHYEAKHRPGRFVIAFPSELEYKPMSLSWGELLGETTCLSSSAEKAVLLPPRASSTLTLAPATRKVHRQPRTRTCLARNCCPMSLRIVIATFPA